MPNARSVAVSMVVGVGSRYEDYEVNGGVSHFLEHLLFKGSRNWPSTQAIGEAIDEVGGVHNAYTGNDLTNYYIKVPKRHAKLAYNILADMMRYPILDETEVDRERTVVVEEMNVWRDDPAHAVYDLLPQVLWPHDPLGKEVIGSKEVITTISRDAIYDFQQLHYGPENIVVSVAGDVEHESVVGHIVELMGDMKRHKIQRITKLDARYNDQQVIAVEQDTKQAHLLIGCRAYAYNKRLEPAARVLATILGGGLSSRLFLELRERQGLAYSVFSDYNSFVDTGAFSVYAGVSPDNIGRAMQVIMSELARLKVELVGDAELTKVKHKLAGGLQLALESTSAIADRVGSRMVLLNEVKLPDEIIAEIEAVTAEDIQAVAKDLFKSQHMRLAAIAPNTKPAKQAFIKELENI
jgi:predicted Zn-dependent peptidase